MLRVGTAAVGAAAVTVAEDVALLLGAVESVVADAIVAVLLIVAPTAVAGFTFKTSVKLALVLAGNDAIVQVIVPAAPTAGLAQANDGPLFCVSDTKVVLTGSTSVSVTVCASLGPLFVAVMLYEMFPA